MPDRPKVSLKVMKIDGMTLCQREPRGKRARTAGRPYQELGADYFDRRLDPERETRRLIAKLEALGHQVTLDAAV
jgi:hypothetical protein